MLVKKKLVLIPVVIFVIFLLSNFLNLTNQPDTSHDYLRIYIRPDGSVWPPETPIHLEDNIYYLVGNLTKKIHIQKSNIILDGNGYCIETYSSETRGNPQSHITNINNVTLRHISRIGHSSLTLTNASFCTITDTNLPVKLVDSHNNTYTQNYSGSATLINSQNNTISKNAIFSVSLENSFNNKILNNSMSWLSTSALDIIDSSNNLFFKNQISLQCHRWITLEGNSNQNLFVANQINGHFVLEPKIAAKNNTFYQNNFIDPFEAKFNETGTISQANNWNNNQQGNYWNNYQGEDINNDGIGDTPYIINEENRDNYPLMTPVNLEQIIQP